MHGRDSFPNAGFFAGGGLCDSEIFDLTVHLTM